MSLVEITNVIERFSRQVLVKEIGVEGLMKLMKAKVAIVGCGATGSTAAELLARAGIGFIRVIDRDFVDVSNLPRTHLYYEADALESMPKALAIANNLKKVNSLVKVEPVVTEVDQYNVEKLIKDVDVIFDGTDNMSIRFLLNDASIKLNKPWIYVGVERWYGLIMPIIPGKTACLQCLLSKPPPEVGNICDVLGVLNTTVTIVTSVAVTELIKYLLGFNVGGYLLHVDSFNYEIQKINVTRNPNCRACVYRRFEHLKPQPKIRAKRICGTNAVQVYPKEDMVIDLTQLRKGKLNEKVIEVATPYVVRARVGNYTVILFRDGRAIVDGITNEKLALKIYDSLLEKIKKLYKKTFS